MKPCHHTGPDLVLFAVCTCVWRTNWYCIWGLLDSYRCILVMPTWCLIKFCFGRFKALYFWDRWRNKEIKSEAWNIRSSNSWIWWLRHSGKPGHLGWIRIHLRIFCGRCRSADYYTAPASPPRMLLHCVHPAAKWEGAQAQTVVHL